QAQLIEVPKNFRVVAKAVLVHQVHELLGSEVIACLRNRGLTGLELSASELFVPFRRFAPSLPRLLSSVNHLLVEFTLKVQQALHLVLRKLVRLAEGLELTHDGIIN